MALGFGVPTALGLQRDSSTLRLRAGWRAFRGPSLSLMPWLEFFHTHRDFYGATVLLGEPSLFVDEAILSLGLAIEL